MLNLPLTTEFSKRVPKQMFYEKTAITPALKKVFVEQIKSITWANKIAPTTLNISEGKSVTEIQVIRILLHSDNFDVSVLKHIDKAIPYHNIYVLEYDGKFQVWLRFRDDSENFTKYFNTTWLPEAELPLKIDGLNLDTVYENFVLQVSGIEKVGNDSVAVQIKNADKTEKLKIEIARLEKQARAEKQPKKKFELAQKIKKLNKKIQGG